MEKLKIFIFQNELPQANYLKDLLETCGYEVIWTLLPPKDNLRTLGQKSSAYVFLDFQKDENENRSGRILTENQQEEIKPSNSSFFLDDLTKKHTPMRSKIRNNDIHMDDYFKSEQVVYSGKCLPEPSKKKQGSSHSFIFEDSFFIRSNSALVKLKLEEIMYLEADANYTQIFTTEKKYTIRASLKDLEEKLNDNRFARVHKSFLINLEKIENIQADLIQIAAREIPIGRQQYRWLTAKIKIL
jgi:hypothetical protein